MARQRNKPSKAEQCRRAKGALKALRQRANPTWYVNFGVGFIGCYMLLHISGLSFLRKALIFWNYRCQNKDIRIDWNVNVPLTRHLLNAPDISAPFGFASKGEVSTTPEIGHVITLHTFLQKSQLQEFHNATLSWVFAPLPHRCAGSKYVPGRQPTAEWSHLKKIMPEYARWVQWSETQ